MAATSSRGQKLDVLIFVDTSTPFPFSLIYSNANAGEEKSMVHGTWPFFDNYTRKVR